MDAPFVSKQGRGYSTSLNATRRVNLYPVIDPSGKRPLALYGTPGAALYAGIPQIVSGPSLLNIVAWGEYTSSGGIAIDPSEAFNTALASATTVEVTGYYQPDFDDGTSYQAAYPGIAVSPTPFDPTPLTFATASVSLRLSSGLWKDFDALAIAEGLSTNTAIIVRLLVDGTTTIYAVVLISAGV